MMRFWERWDQVCEERDKISVGMGEKRGGVLGVFVGEAAVDHYRGVKAREESGVEGLLDEVDICSVG